MKSSRKLTLWLYMPHQMADLREGRHRLTFGNYWDFHAGCYGTEIQFADGTVIDFKSEWHSGVRGPHSVSQMIAKKIGATVVVKYRKTPMPC